MFRYVFGWRNKSLGKWIDFTESILLVVVASDDDVAVFDDFYIVFFE